MRAIIRYCEKGSSEVIAQQVHLHGESNTIPVDYRKNAIVTSLNPYLQGYFNYPSLRDGKPCIAHMLDFDELTAEAERVVFFIYLKDYSLRKGPLEIMKYPHPACALEMEVRFIFDRCRHFSCVEGIDKRKLRWSGTLKMAQQLKDKKSFNQLNILAFAKGGGILEEMQLNIRKQNAEIIDVITEFDKTIICLVEGL